MTTATTTAAIDAKIFQKIERFRRKEIIGCVVDDFREANQIAAERRASF